MKRKREVPRFQKKARIENDCNRRNDPKAAPEKMLYPQAFRFLEKKLRNAAHAAASPPKTPNKRNLPRALNAPISRLPLPHHQLRNFIAGSKF
ncbi:hypothetical protein [Bradyrhizobium australiense]|uniref:Uncharacterized protein n=1 Tax=Bradyrhizobium australiense TaxID=2721161 RepID=A0A7Y4LYK4_9BRAD|nr:hypothetical protein [Bradyrhizobium australiense]NOJ43351.1 hypothetical protein [Bradyrhizobium australiense]